LFKQNASLEKSPPQTVTAQTNHFVATVWSYIKLELLKDTFHLKHFSLKAKLYFTVLRSAYALLTTFQPIRLLRKVSSLLDTFKWAAS